MALLKINFSFSCENNGDPRAGGYRGDKRAPVYRKNIEKDKFDNKYLGKEVNEKQRRHKK